MGQLTTKYCIKCHGFTNHEWHIDRDSDPGEPQFSQNCLRCECVDLTIEQCPQEIQGCLQ